MTRITLYDLAVRFRQPLVTAAGVHTGRRSVIVAVERDGVTGWGEAATMPSGAWGTIDEVWDELAASGGDAAPRGVGPAAAALQAAHADREARGAGVPLWRHLGATGRAVPARVTFGLYDDPDDLVTAVRRAAATGVIAVKIKIAPGRDLPQIAAVRRALPDLDVSVDANGTYRSPDDPVFAGLDELGVGLVEQPLPPGDLAGAAALRDRIGCSVCLDEAIRSPQDAGAAIAAAAVDVLSLKIGRLGLAVSREILAMAVAAGVGIKAGGTFDTAVGRHLILAFAGLPGVVDAEAGPPDAYLIDPPGRYPAMVAGEITPHPGPGIGDAVDPETLGRQAIRTLEVRNPG